MLKMRARKIRIRKREIIEYILAPIKDYSSTEQFSHDRQITASMQIEARNALVEVCARIQKNIAELEGYHRIVQTSTSYRFGQPRLFQPGINAYKYRYYMYDIYKALRAEDWCRACMRLQEVLILYRNCALQSAITIHKMLEDTLCTSNSTKKP